MSIELQNEKCKPCHDHGPRLEFEVDGEDYYTHAKELTPDDIIKDFAGRDPKTNYLVQIEGRKRISYEGKGDQPIKLHKKMKFQVICTGPTPVS